MSGYVVDTNIISETIKSSPNPNVVNWLEDNSRSLYLTSITIEELRFGEFMMAEGKKRKAISGWIDSLMSEYSKSVLDFDARSAVRCAEMHEIAVSKGRVPSIEDLMIAGIASANNCAVVTRNIKDFDFLDIEIINPFDFQ